MLDYVFPDPFNWQIFPLKRGSLNAFIIIIMFRILNKSFLTIYIHYIPAEVFQHIMCNKFCYESLLWPVMQIVLIACQSQDFEDYGLDILEGNLLASSSQSRSIGIFLH
jgi:hypothetical protein